MPRMMRINRRRFCAMSSVGVTMMFVACSFGGSQGNDPQPDAATSGAHCGDGTCAASEVNNCPADCGGGSNQGSNAVCGNGQCETTKGETAASCPSDCMSQGSGSGSGSGMCPADPTACLGCILDMTQCTGGLSQ